MIIKANRHNDGAKLARYMMTGYKKDGERAELGQLKGFDEADNILDAFRDVEIMAGGSKASNALFHVQVRLPEHERLSPEQWEATADRIERRLGLTGQGRAVYFHVKDATGERHMHAAWSLIDPDTLKAIPLPYFKFRLKSLARELEKEFGLTRVKNEREGPIKFAATRDEQQQAQRLGVDKDAVRNAIRACWDRSDCGRSFEAALAEEGLVLAKGDKRDYLVLDHAGGLHALGKRLLDISMPKVREKLADLDSDRIPTVEAAREFLLDLPRDRVDRLTRQLSEVEWQIKAEREYGNRDPVRDEIQWQQALDRAAIEKEERERKFLEPHPEKTPTGRQEKESGAELGRTAGEIRLAYSLTQTGQEFANALEDRGFILARVTEEDAERLNRWDRQRRSEEWKAPAPASEKQKEKKTDYNRYKAGDLAVVTQNAQVHPLTRGNTGEGSKDRTEHLKDIDRAALLSVTNAENVMRGVQRERKEERAQERARKREEILRDAAEKHWPTRPPQPDRKSPGLFEQAAEQASRDDRVESLRGPAALIWKLWTRVDPEKYAAKIKKDKPFSVATDTKAFAAALDEKGIGLAVATKEEADHSHKLAALARAASNYAPRFKEGEIVIVTAPRPEYRREGQIVVPPRVHKINQSLADKFVKALGNRSELQGIEATKQVLVDRARERAVEWEGIRLKNATKTRRRGQGRAAIPNAPDLGKASARAIGSVFGALGKLADGFSLDGLTPKEKYEAAKRDHANEKEADKNEGFAAYIADLAAARLERQREAEQHREREPERERDR
jgi:hypothetical protein